MSIIEFKLINDEPSFSVKSEEIIKKNSTKLACKNFSFCNVAFSAHSLGLIVSKRYRFDHIRSFRTQCTSFVGLSLWRRYYLRELYGWLTPVDMDQNGRKHNKETDTDTIIRINT